MNIGIIGAGGIAYKLHLPQLTTIPGVRVTHLAGREEHRLRILAEKYDVPYCTTDYQALLADDRVDAVVVALPHPLHVPFGLQVLQAGKHLLMQKPLCGRMDEADRFVEAVERSDRIVYCLPHFGSEVRKARQLLQSGAIGRFSGASCRASHGGPEVYYAEVRDAFQETGEELWFFKEGEAAVGALFDMGVYAVATLVAIAGSVRAVTGMIATVAKPTTLEDTATLILQFESGAPGTAETGWCDPARTWQWRVHGTAGKLVSPGESGAPLTRWEPGSYTREDVPAIPHAVDCSDIPVGNAHEEWIRCIRENRQPDLCHAWAARHVTEVLLAGLESARSGQRVTLRTRAERM